MDCKVKDSSIPPSLLPDVVDLSGFVDLLNKRLDTDAATKHVLQEGKSCIGPGFKLLLFERDVVPHIKANAVAVASAWSEVKADPLGGVEEVVLNLLTDGVVQGGVIKRAPRDDGLVQIVHGTAQCGKAGLSVLEIVVRLEATQKRVDEVESAL